MNKKVVPVILILLVSFSIVLAAETKTVDSEIQKLTHFAEQYETDNIDYIQLLIYISSAREGLNEILGVTNKEMGGIVKQDAIEKNIADQYNGNANGVLQIVDGEEIVFNLYIQVNEQDLMEIKPMLPEEVPSQDITVKMEFAKLYDLINFEEKEMRGAELESPPWDKKPRHGKIKGMTNGIKSYLKVRSLMNSAEVTPDSVKGDVEKLMKAMLKGMGDYDDKKREEMERMEKENENQEENPQENQGMTGKAINEPSFKF